MSEYGGLKPYRPEVQVAAGPDVSRDVELSVEALSILGVVNNEDEVKENLTSWYRGLADIQGVLYPEVPYEVVSTARLMAKAANPSGEFREDVSGLGDAGCTVETMLWLPGERDFGYTAEELSKASLGKFGAGIALCDTEYLDSFSIWGRETELGDIGTRVVGDATIGNIYARECFSHVVEYKQARAVKSLSHRALLMIALESKIADVDMPSFQGFVCDLNLPIKEDLVGIITGHGNNLFFDSVGKHAIPNGYNVGFGLTAHLLEP